jgi:serine/threonine protein kinase
VSAQVITGLNWTLGPYRIVGEIGRGQFGTVYEADAGGRQIALKLVPVHGLDSDEKVAAERQGATLQQRFSRAAKHLVPEVLDHHRLDPYYCIAMELVSGQPLTNVIKAGRTPEDRAATIALAISEFLVKAHEFAAAVDDDGGRAILVHGDLKPAHILLLDDGSIRVLDFGIAKALAARKAATTNLWSSVDYASPERLESGRVNEQADFWSVGVILFEMLAGLRPYANYEHSRSRLETAIRTQEPRLRVPADVDPRLTAIVDKLLAPQVENRYHTARQIRDDLQAFLERAPVIAFIEASRANQATVRIQRAAADMPGVPTVPVSVLREPVPTLTWPGREDPAPRSSPPPVESAASSPAVVVTPAATTAESGAAAPWPSAVPTPPPSRASGYKPWIAAVLSFLAPGLGQIYNRDFLRGIFWLIVTPGFWVGSAGLLGWPFHLIAAYTAYRRALAPPEVRARSPLPLLRRRAVA